MIRFGQVSLLLSLSLFLTACGGGGEDVVTTDGVTDSDTETGDDGTSSTVVPAIGSGVGDSFVEGELTLSVEKLLSGESGNLTANIVDTASDNALVTTEDYYVVYSSSCATLGDSTLGVTESTVSNGVATSSYLNKTCSGEDSLTVTFYDSEDGVSLGQATATLETVFPDLGSGSGDTFQQGVLSASDTNILSNETVDVSFSVVDPETLVLTDGLEYYVSFNSPCAASGDAAFSEAGIFTTAGTGKVSYTPSTCEGEDKLSFKLYYAESGTADLNTVLDEASVTINVSLPDIGSGEGDSFESAVLTAEKSTILYGASTDFSATIVDPLNGNELIQDQSYYVKYSSDCVTYENSEFSEEGENTSSGFVKTTYSSSLCESTDEITFSLFNSDGASFDASKVLATANFTLNIVMPGLGNGSEGDYVDGQLSIDADTLSAFGSTEVRATVVDPSDNNSLVRDVEYYVEYESDCVAGGYAEFSEDGAVASDGEILVTYTDDGCEGTDDLTFSLYPIVDGNPDFDQLLTTATGQIDIAEIEVGNVSYIESTSTSLSLSQIENAVLPKEATLTFQVLDKNNNPIKQRVVSFSLSNTSGGIELSEDSGETDEEGFVDVVLHAGTSHAKVSVKATTEGNEPGETISTNSISHSITTGVADQDSFSIVLSKYSTPGWNQSGAGTEVEVTAFVNDHFQNPVPDGTVINFASDAGSIPSTCETANGSCSVTWVSAEPLPGADETGQLFTNDGSRPYDTSKVTVDPLWTGGLPGAATIVAYTEGEGSFSDENGNNLYDDGESFEALDEAFIDANESVAFDFDSDTNPREDFFDYNEDGSFTSAPATYQGISCADSSTHCQSMVHVRDSKSFIVSSVENTTRNLTITGSVGGDLTSTSCYIMAPGEVITYSLNAIDINGNMPPAGTEMSIEPDDLVVLGDDSFVVDETDSGTDGIDFTFYLEGDDAEPLENLARPTLTLTQVDGVGVIRRPDTQLTNNTVVTSTPDQLPATAGTTLNVVFTDECGIPVTGNLQVIVELSNGVFASGEQEAQYATVTSTIAIDFLTDGDSSYDASGMTLNVFRPGESGSSTATFSVYD